MFDGVIEESAGDLGNLWQIVSTDQSFLPVQGRDFVVRSVHVPYDGKPFAGIRFTKAQLNLPTPDCKWKPFQDHAH